MEQYAKAKRICIILPNTRTFLKELCGKLNPKNILEVGTAIGYSASTMLFSCDANITCCEASAPNIVLAKQNFERLHLMNRVNIVEGDCLKTLPILNEIINSTNVLKAQEIKNIVDNKTKVADDKNDCTNSMSSQTDYKNSMSSQKDAQKGDLKNFFIQTVKESFNEQKCPQTKECLTNLQTLQGERFDLIFLDGPKGFYPDILKLLLPLLAKNGVLVTDNVSFRGMVSGKKQITEPRFEKTVKALHQFIDDLKNNKDLNVEIKEIGDGLAIASWKNNL